MKIWCLIPTIVYQQHNKFNEFLPSSQLQFALVLKSKPSCHCFVQTLLSFFCARFLLHNFTVSFHVVVLCVLPLLCHRHLSLCCTITFHVFPFITPPFQSDIVFAVCHQRFQNFQLWRTLSQRETKFNGNNKRKGRACLL